MDDWSERFPQSSRRFLQYTHPRGQDLKAVDGFTVVAIEDTGQHLGLPKDFRVHVPLAFEDLGLSL